MKGEIVILPKVGRRAKKSTKGGALLSRIAKRTA
jgi:hypothetical protein